MQELSVFIATPSHTGEFCTQWVKSMIETTILLTAAGVRMTAHLVSGSPYLAAARNQIVHEFMQSGFTDLLFIDADVGWEPKALVKILPRPQDIVAGVYPLKRDKEPGYPVVIDTDGDGYPVVDHATGLIRAAGLPGGFLKIKRRAFEVMMAAYPDLAYEDFETGQTLYNLFDCRLVGGRWIGEDFYFCQLWRELGGQVWVDPDLVLSHTGIKTWSGNYHEYLKSCPRA